MSCAFQGKTSRRALHDGASAGNAGCRFSPQEGVSLLVAFFIVFSILNMEVDEQRRHFAMLRMAGFTRRQLFLILFFEAFFFALTGWICGLAAGAVLLKLLNLPLHLGFWSIAVSGIFSCIATFGRLCFPPCARHPSCRWMPLQSRLPRCLGKSPVSCSASAFCFFR